MNSHELYITYEFEEGPLELFLLYLDIFFLVIANDLDIAQ